MNSRLLIVDLCDGMHMEELPGDVIVGASDHCGNHDYLINDDGLKLIYRISKN